MDSERNKLKPKPITFADRFMLWSKGQNRNIVRDFFFPKQRRLLKKKKKSLFLYLVYMALCMHSLQVVVVWCTLPYCIEYSRTISLFYTKDVQKMKVKSLSRVQFFTNPWTVVCQAPPSMGFSRQEYWSGVPFPSPGCPEASVKAVVLSLALLYFSRLVLLN